MTAIRMNDEAAMFLGIEIGGTKLQLGIGAGDGKLEGVWRGTVDVAAGPPAEIRTRSAISAINRRALEQPARAAPSRSASRIGL